MKHPPTTHLRAIAAKTGHTLLAGTMALALTPAIALANPLSAPAAQLSTEAQARTYDYEGGYELAKAIDGTTMWPDGEWVKTDQPNTYAWKTYVKGDNAHYGHYDATITFTVEDDVLTAIDMTSLGTTFGGKWGTLTPHDGAMFVTGYLPEGISDKTDITVTAEGYAVTPNLDGVATYGGSAISQFTVYKATADGAKTEIGTVAKVTSGRGANSTTSWVATPVEGQPDTFASYDADEGVLTVSAEEANLVLVKETIGDYYVFGQYYGLDEDGEAAALAVTAAEKTDMTREATGIGAKDRDVYTAAAYSLILQRELPSWLISMNDESATGQIEDLDIISAATKSSHAVIESLYATQGYAYPIANHDDATATKADWEPIFSGVSNNLKITMDGRELSGDATSATKNDSDQYVLVNNLFGDDIAVAGFDFYKLDGEQTTADLWNLGKGARKDNAIASYLTNYTNSTGHGLVGAYGVKPTEIQGRSVAAGANPYGDANKDPLEDVLTDSMMSYDPATRAITVKDPSVTHVVVQYAVGKFSDSNGGVCGVVYDLAELAAQSEDPDVETTAMLRLYNPNSGEHFYTDDPSEKDDLVSLGWKFEGEAWNAPVGAGIPVYRLYNPNAGDHHYTPSASEKDDLVSLGWQLEGEGWQSAQVDEETPLPGAVGLLRLYNPNAQAGSHHYTLSESEKDDLEALGWRFEGYGWYGYQLPSA